MREYIWTNWSRIEEEIAHLGHALQTWLMIKWPTSFSRLYLKNKLGIKVSRRKPSFHRHHRRFVADYSMRNRQNHHRLNFIVRIQKIQCWLKIRKLLGHFSHKSSIQMIKIRQKIFQNSLIRPISKKNEAPLFGMITEIYPKTAEFFCIAKNYLGW